MYKHKQYEFACKKVILNNEGIYYKPVVRLRRTGFMKFLFPNPWDRIIIVYNTPLLMELPFDPPLSLEECREHIEKYKARLQDSVKNEINNETFEDIEQFNI